MIVTLSSLILDSIACGPFFAQSYILGSINQVSIHNVAKSQFLLKDYQINGLDVTNTESESQETNGLNGGQQGLNFSIIIILGF